MNLYILYTYCWEVRTYPVWVYTVYKMGAVCNRCLQNGGVRRQSTKADPPVQLSWTDKEIEKEDFLYDIAHFIFYVFDGKKIEIGD